MAQQKPQKTESLLLKGTIIFAMTVLLLIPSIMIQGLIKERKDRRDEAVQNIDAKWSYAQTLSGPVLTVPYVKTVTEKGGKLTFEEHVLNITPESLDYKVVLKPEEKYYGIYRTIVYNSVIQISGKFGKQKDNSTDTYKYNWNQAYLKFGMSDLRGISEEITFRVNGSDYGVVSTGVTDDALGRVLMVMVNDYDINSDGTFSSTINMRGSGSINFIPMGQNTKVFVEGDWGAPGFIGNYSPESNIDDKNNHFNATWNVLRYNRSIPDSWTDDNIEVDYSYDYNRKYSSSYSDYARVNNWSFGVTLIDEVDLYQQNMRSAKYAILFIALTFIVFFMVEVITRKRIHPLQYLLVGIALIVFYSLLLSISEQLGFGLAYLISSVAVIGMITGYAGSIFRNRRQTIVLAIILVLLYAFLYTILQLKDTALLVGSIGLFVILAVIMYFSRHINWYNPDRRTIEGQEELPEKTQE